MPTFKLIMATTVLVAGMVSVTVPIWCRTDDDICVLFFDGGIILVVTSLICLLQSIHEMQQLVLFTEHLQGIRREIGTTMSLQRCDWVNERINIIKRKEAS